MNGIDFAVISAAALGEGFAIQVFQEAFTRKLLEDRAEGHFYKLRGAELIAALGDVHGSELTGPFVDVLKNKAMNCLEVGRVKSANSGFESQFDQAVLRSRGLELIKH